MAGCFKVVNDTNSDDPWSSAPGIGSSFIRPAIEECPYYKHHRVPKEKMMMHMMKCRKVYLQKCKQNGEIPLTLTCKYNIEHVVYAPEIMYHEERCTDADFVPTYLLNTEPFKDCPGYDPAFQTLEPTQAELDKLYEGCYIDTFIGADSFGLPVPLSELEEFNATYQYLDELCDIAPEEPQEEKEEAAKSAVEKGGAGVGDDNDQTGTPTPGPSSKCSASRALNDEGSDEEEFWESDANEPNFSYMQNMYNPKKPIFTYPPGLTKREKIEYVKFNTKWANDLGIRRLVQVTGIQGDREDEEKTAIPKYLTLATEEDEVEEQGVHNQAEVDEELHQVSKNDDDTDFEVEDDDKSENENEEQDYFLEDSVPPLLKYKLEKEKYDFVEWNTLNLFWIMIIEEAYNCQSK